MLIMKIKEKVAMWSLAGAKVLNAVRLFFCLGFD
jgi:hypothetical protein